MPAHILIVDDEPIIMEALERFLKRQGFAVTKCENYTLALEQLQAGNVDLALIDLKLKDRNGLELIREIQQHGLKTKVIIMTGYGSIESAITAIKEGAFHYVTKPFELANLLNLVHKALEQQAILKENLLLREQLRAQNPHQHFVGEAPNMRRLQQTIRQVAKADSTVLILGESGTGKELVARALHEQSGRGQKPLVAVNCAAIPDSLLEAELFGHVKGAFTGAHAHRQGRFALADGGTIFLDEIGEMNPRLQVKLLRVLQERKIEPIGSSHSIEIDVRILAATHQDLEAAMRAGRFREDLFYRLNVIPIKVPPLRERKADIAPLMQYFLQKFTRTHGMAAPQLSPAALDACLHYDWPGNVRELENYMERLAILAPGQEVGPELLALQNTRELKAEPVLQAALGRDNSFKEMVSRFENELILQALEKTEGNKNQAANLLGLNRTTLVEMIKRRQLDKRLGGLE